MIPRERLTGQNLISPRQKVALLHFTFKSLSTEEYESKDSKLLEDENPTC